jgi:DNA invertase Pin-like site-specific DNA recombinase
MRNIERFMKKTIGYSRVSTLNQISNSSLSNQEKAIREYCRTHNLELSKVYFDTASGTNQNENLSKVLKCLYSNSNNIDTLVVTSFDRVFRSVANMSQVLVDFKKRGCKIISIKENFDLESPVGEFMLNVFSSISQFELEMIKNRVCNGKIAKKELFKSEDSNMKLYLGGSIPYGYKVIKIIQNSKHFKVLVQDEVQQQVILRINSELKQNKSLQEIADSLNKDKIMTQRDKKWSKTQIWRINKDINL